MQFTNVKYCGCDTKFTVGKEYTLFDNGIVIDNYGTERRWINWKWELSVYTICRTLGINATKLIVEKVHTQLTKKEVVAKSKCFGHQVDGTHYTDMELQPLEMAYLRYGIEGLKAAIHTKVDKYITRKKDDEVKQLKKAAHCMEILIEMTELHNQHFNK